MAKNLPGFVSPMLARAGEPFDDEKFWCEIKWDGIRALLFKDGSGSRLLSRNGNRIEARCPKALEVDIPKGSVLDGELVAFRDGAPDFGSSLEEGTEKILVAFDILYQKYESVMDQPLSSRREILEGIVPEGEIITVPQIHSKGTELFEHVSAQGIEGIVAKRIDSQYFPGKRSDSWIKIKRGSSHKSVHNIWRVD